MQRVFGYGRGTKSDPAAIAQTAALLQAGVPSEHIFVDQLRSSTKAGRAGFDNLRKALQRRDVLFVSGIDRLGRSLVEALEVVQELLAAGVLIKLGNEKIDGTKARGRATLKIIAALADLQGRLSDELNPEETPPEGRRSPGRPSAIAGTVRTDAKRLLSAGVPVPDVARRLGIGRSTLYKARTDLLTRDGRRQVHPGLPSIPAETARAEQHG
jgi:DNA invertase Pin-like site-specific DNA recombinase